MNEFQRALVEGHQKAKPAEKSAQGWGEHWVILQPPELGPLELNWFGGRRLTDREEDEPEGADYEEAWRGPDADEIEPGPESDEEADHVAEWVKDIEIDSDEDWEEPCGRRSLFWRP